MWPDRRAALRRSNRGPALRLCLCLALVAVLILPGTAALAQDDAGLTLQIADERPVRGETVRITVRDGLGPAPGAQVTAIYRPNSTTSATEELPAVDASGTLLWTPTHAGPVTLEVRPAGAEAEAAAATTHTIAVRFGTLPASGLLIMVLAGLLLFGGAAVAFYLLLKQPAHTPASEPPST